MVSHKITPRHGGKGNYFALFQWSQVSLVHRKKYKIFSAQVYSREAFLMHLYFPISQEIRKAC